MHCGLPAHPSSILSCRQMPVGSEDSITVSYAQPGYGGMPYVSPRISPRAEPRVFKS